MSDDQRNLSAREFSKPERPQNVLIRYPFPVCGGEMVAILEIPKWFSQLDADRLKRLIDTLVTEASTVITFPDEMSPEQRETFLKEWRKRHG